MNIASAEWTPLAGWMLGCCCLELHVYLLQHLKKVQHFPQMQYSSVCLSDTPRQQCLCTHCTNITHTQVGPDVEKTKQIISTLIMMVRMIDK